MELCEFEKKYITDINNAISNIRIKNLFNQIPSMTIEAFNRTAVYAATKEYEEFISQNGIPQNFYTILEKSVANNGILKTYRLYQKQIELICAEMNIDNKTIINLLKIINAKSTNTLVSYEVEQTNARQQLREIIRKFTSIYKERIIKKIITAKKDALEQTITYQNTPDNSFILNQDLFIKTVMHNEQAKDKIKQLIFEHTSINDISDIQLQDILTAIFNKNASERIAEILDIKIIKNTHYNKSATRLKTTFISVINEILLNQSIETRIIIIKYLNLLAKQKKENITIPEVQQLKAHISQMNTHLFEEISTLMAKSDSKAVLTSNGTMNFLFPGDIKTDITKSFLKSTPEMRLKSLHKKIFSLYKEQNKALVDFIGKEALPKHSEESEYQIDTTAWLNFQKIQDLVSTIKEQSINNLTEKEYNELNKFLNQNGLLWGYISGNIPLDIISKIINNFSSIYSSMKNEDININKLDEIIRKANLYDFADPIAIGLYGPNIISKIINYNQFAGIQVTEETIKKRIRKAVDLAVRGERSTKSSLPYNITCQEGNLKLRRYKNNDPLIMLSGVETKTCFFISVNENDFFFYSILNKDGFVIQITDTNDNLIARASCFRKNNILMINGIRYQNNKVIPETKEDMDNFRSVIKLIELMGKKVIEATTGDECPIDHVVCNLAGLLENPEFERKYMRVEPTLFREPLNIYSEEWEQFIHTYDDADEQFLQEVTNNGGKSFTTDFGNHYPALIIASRENKYLDYPRDISLDDQKATYERPRIIPEEYIKEEIDEKLLLRLNRLKALSCFTGPSDEIKIKIQNYSLINNIEDIKNVIIGEDWYIIIYNNNSYDFVYANAQAITFKEAKLYLERINKVATQNELQLQKK